MSNRREFIALLGGAATAGRPAPRLRECYRSVRAQASTTTLPASLASTLRSRRAAKGAASQAPAGFSTGDAARPSVVWCRI
jgi:hypothetical protein